MKLIKSIKLFFQEGNSDKVYEIDLLESGDDAYVVNFRYGRRGASLKEGTKTVFPVPLAEAEKVFKALEDEKRKKGYAAEGENTNFIQDITPAKTDASSSKREKAIIKNLKAVLNDEESETWPTSRIIWRAGELNLKAAAPLIIQADIKSNNIELYSTIWALGRIGDVKAIPYLKDLFKRNDYPSYIYNLNYAAILNIGDDTTVAEYINILKAKLPESLKQLLNDPKQLDVYLKDVFTKFGQGTNEFIVPLYLVSIKDENLRRLFLNNISLVPTKAGYFKYLRQVFKISEMLNDVEVYSILVKVIESSKYNFSSSYEYINGMWGHVSEELKKENSSLAFSKNTKLYFGRRIQRTLRKLGEDKSPLYTKYATAILLNYNEAKDNPRPEKISKSEYVYDSAARRYNVVQKIWWFDVYSEHLGFNYILYANSTRFVLKKGKARWEAVAPYEPGQPYQPMREEAFATLWNNFPDDIIRLLCESKCEKVSDFALHVFSNNASFKDKVSEQNIVAFLKNPSLKIQQLGFDLAKHLYPKSVPPAAMLVALLLSNISEAQEFAQKWIDKEPGTFANDPEFISIILASKNYNSHNWLTAFLLKNKVLPEVGTEVLNAILSFIDSEEINSDKTHMQSLTNIAETCFKDAITKLSPDVIFNLLLQTNLNIQGFAARLLVVLNPKPELVSDKLIFSMLQSENTVARTAAIDLLNNLEPYALAEKQSLVLGLCLSPLQDVRQSAQKLIDKLLAADSSLGSGLVNLFMPVLTVKEKHEGLHQDILDLIKSKLSAYLSKVEKKQILALCSSRYTASQELGCMLLEKNIKLNDLEMKEIVSLANANLLKIREQVTAYYSNHIPRIKSDKNVSVVLADGVWGDVRKFAFDFFRNNFSAEDWTPELFVALCDSIKKDVQAFGREMITKWFEKDKGFEYLLKLSQHPDSRMQLFASGFLENYAKNNHEMLKKLGDFFITLLSQVNKGHTAKVRAINLLSEEAKSNEQNAVLIATIFNRMSATVAIQDKALYIQGLLSIRKAFPSVDVVLNIKETPIYKSNRHANAV